MLVSKSPNRKPERHGQPHSCHLVESSRDTSPECKGGSFHATKDSEAKAQEAVAELHRREEKAKPVIVSLTPEKR